MRMPRKSAEFFWNKVAGLNINIPDEVAYYEREHPHEKWEIYTWEDVQKNRAERDAKNVSYKRLPDAFIKPCHIWVFDNENVDFFGGIYTYIRTRSKDWGLHK